MTLQIMRLKKAETSRSDHLVQVTKNALADLPTELNMYDVRASGESVSVHNRVSADKMIRQAVRLGSHAALSPREHGRKGRHCFQLHLHAEHHSQSVRSEEIPRTPPGW